MFLHDTDKESALRLSRFDEQHLLSSVSPHPIELEGQRWPTAEHYFWVQVVKKQKFREKILNASAMEAFKIGAPWYRTKVEGWKQKRRFWMTRALYTKVQMHAEVRRYLMDTENQLIIETSMYDYYWGIGRDQRGLNVFGSIWMDIRRRLRKKPEPAPTDNASN